MMFVKETKSLPTRCHHYEALSAVPAPAGSTAGFSLRPIALR